jgi:hypothetical protein
VVTVIVDRLARPHVNHAADTITVPPADTIENIAIRAHEYAQWLMRDEIAHLPRWRQEVEISKAALRAFHDAGCSADSFRRASRRLAVALSTYLEAEGVARWIVERHVPPALDAERWRG